MTQDELYMQRCIDLARAGAGFVSPNPMVGCIIVYNNRIIAEGWHEQFGGPHAEVNAIKQVADENLLRDSTLYVTLEPCSHYGKTPPCADLIIQKKLKRVVIGMVDPYEKVSGDGIKKLTDAGIEVQVGVLEEACKELNKRFITYVTKKRPYVILKWAQSNDGFLAPDASKMSAAEFEEKRHITGFTVQKLVHKWRSEEDSIMVGTRTIETDNPSLNVRAWKGRNPVRISIDKSLKLRKDLKLFDGTQPTILFFDKNLATPSQDSVTFIPLDFHLPILSQICNVLYERGIQSLIVEGGRVTLQHFIDENLWDEAQVFRTAKILSNGVTAPMISGAIQLETEIDHNHLTIYRNQA